MPAPNLFLVYVNDAERSTAFYSDLFGIEPGFVTPRYVSFEIATGVHFSLWSRGGPVERETPRTSEVGLMLDGGADAIEARYAEWVTKGVTVVAEPYDDVYGRTFVVADPDGNLIRVAPFD